MTIPGLSLFYAGLVGRKNVLSVLMHCFMITAIMSVLWVVCGYSIAFGEGNEIWGGMGRTSQKILTASDLSDGLPDYLFFAFQMTFLSSLQPLWWVRLWSV